MRYIWWVLSLQDQWWATHTKSPQQVTDYFSNLCHQLFQGGKKPPSNRKAIQLNVKKCCSLLLVPLVGLMHPASLDCSSNGFLCCHPPQSRQAHREGERGKGGFRITAGGISIANGLKRSGFFYRRWNIYLTAKSFAFTNSCLPATIKPGPSFTPILSQLTIAQYFKKTLWVTEKLPENLRDYSSIWQQVNFFFPTLGFLPVTQNGSLPLFLYGWYSQ